MPSKRRPSRQKNKKNKKENHRPAHDDGNSSETDYEVDAILDHWPNYMGRGELRYLLAWKGYPPEWNEWVPVECLAGCPDMLKEYNEKLDQERSDYQPSLQTGSKKRRSASQKFDPAYVYEGFDLRTVKVDDIPQENRERIGREVSLRHFGMLSSWESVVQKIVGVRTMEDDCLAFDLDFERGFQFSFKEAVVRKRCPQKLISFLMERSGLPQSQPSQPIQPSEITTMTQTGQAYRQDVQPNQLHQLETSQRNANEMEELTEQMAARWGSVH